MSRKPNRTPKAVASHLWVSSKSSMRGPDGDPAWDHHASGAPGISKYLEFADIALGIKKPASKKKRPQSVHDVNKTEPYSGSR